MSRAFLMLAALALVAGVAADCGFDGMEDTQDDCGRCLATEPGKISPCVFVEIDTEGKGDCISKRQLAAIYGETTPSKSKPGIEYFWRSSTGQRVRHRVINLQASCGANGNEWKTKVLEFEAKWLRTMGGYRKPGNTKLCEEARALLQQQNALIHQQLGGMSTSKPVSRKPQEIPKYGSMPESFDNTVGTMGLVGGTGDKIVGVLSKIGEVGEPLKTFGEVVGGVAISTGPDLAGLMITKFATMWAENQIHDVQYIGIVQLDLLPKAKAVAKCMINHHRTELIKFVDVEVDHGYLRNFECNVPCSGFTYRNSSRRAIIKGQASEVLDMPHKGRALSKKEAKAVVAYLAAAQRAQDRYRERHPPTPKRSLLQKQHVLHRRIPRA